MTAILTRDQVVTELGYQGRTARRRHTRVLGLLSLAALLLLGTELVLGGSADIPAGDVLPAALGLRDGLADYVVHGTRAPRALVAVLAGALFGLAGQLYQRLIGNPLATPDVLGISAGAGAAAVAVITLGATGLGVQVAAVSGAVAVGLLVFGLSWRGGLSPYRLVLVGIGVGACAAGVTTYLVTRADEMSTQRALRWLVGSLTGSDGSDVQILAGTLVLGLVAVALLGPALRTFAVGDDLAAGLGTRVTGVRVTALVVGAALAAVATSVTGPLGFVALVAGPVAVGLVGRPSAVAAAAVGGVLGLAADVVAQGAPLIAPVPTGSVTAVLGAPVLVVLLVRTRRSA